MNFISKFFYSLISLIYLNIFFFIKRIIKNKKTSFFYHSENKINDISIDYINFFFHKKLSNINILFGYNGNKLAIDKYFYINERFLKYLYNVDYFITNYLTNVHPIKSKIIYIHHDIYDTPLVAKKIEKKTFYQLSKIDYIFLSSEIAEQIFKNGFNKYKIKNRPKTIISGYLKLSFLENKKKKIKIFKQNKKIIIAPTQYKSFKNLSIITDLKKLILKLLRNGYMVTLRPHPLNRDDSRFIYLKNFFNTEQKFVFDDSSNYLKSYLNSFVMITDISGTAYTYSFLTLNPVIFYSSLKKEKLINNYFGQNLNYFKNREKIGVINLKEKEILKSIKKMKSKKIKSSILKQKRKIISGKDVQKRINLIFNKLI